MVKKYKLTNSNIKNQNAGNLNFIYPMVPNMTGLMPSNPPLINSNIVMNPYMPGYNGSYVRSDPSGGIKIGVPLVNNNGEGIKMVFPPRLDPRDPSVFYGVEPPKPTAKGPIKNVNLTFKEAMPKQSIVTFQPTLPIIPNSYGFQLPVGLQANPPILINPTESKARMEITSNESDDIITVSGEQDKIKPIFDGIRNNNKVKIAQEEVTLAKKALEDAENKAPTGKNYDTDYKHQTYDQLNVLDNVNLPSSIRKEVLRLKKAQDNLRIAKNEAKMANDDTDVSSSDLISLADLFDLPKVINDIKTKYSLTDKDFNVKSSKKNNLQMLLGIPYSNYSYGRYYRY